MTNLASIGKTVRRLHRRAHPHHGLLITRKTIFPVALRAQDTEAFSDFFRNMFRQGQGATGPAEDLSASELDVEAILDLSLKDAIHGVEKTFSLLTTGLCQNCRGTGRVKNGFCPVCGGIGEIRKPRDIRTRIPAGLVEGSRIRLKGPGQRRCRSPTGAARDAAISIS